MLLLFCSCHSQSYGILKYQDKKINAECTLNGEYRISIKKDGEKREICFLEPTSLAHISFAIDGEIIVGHAGEVEIPFEAGSVRGLLALSNIFSLSEDSLSVATSNGDVAIMEFSTEYGTYSLTFGKNDLPSSVKIYSDDYRYDISIDAISLY